MSFVIEEAGLFRGLVRFLNISLPDGSIEDDKVAADADIQTTKLRHIHRCVEAQESGTVCADETHVVHVVHGSTGEAKAIKAGAVTPCVGDAVVDIDLLKNGTSILTSKIQLSSVEAAYELVVGTIDTEGLVAGDVLEVDINGTVNTGTLAYGVFVYAEVYEDAS